MTTKTTQKKQGNTWVTTHITEDSATATHSLATELAAHYIGKASYIRSIKRRNNHDGTQTYTVAYDNGYRSVYTTDIY